MATGSIAPAPTGNAFAKWSTVKSALASASAPAGALGSQSEAQLDAEFLRQKIEHEIFGLPLRKASDITDDDIIALIRERSNGALPAATRPR